MSALDRRRLLQGGLALASLAQGWPAFASVAPIAGARGDGASDDTAALQRALSSGRRVDGGGWTYGISGPLTAGPGFRGLANCTLRQLARQDHLRTLTIRGVADFRLSNVTVIRGEQDDEALIQRDMQSNAGLWIEDSHGFTLDKVAVRGGGIGTGLVIGRCEGFTVTDAGVSGIHYRLRQRPRDDMLQGIWIYFCNRFQLVRPVVSDLGGLDDQGFSRDNNRAIAVSGSAAFRIVDLKAADCGQGLDVTGSDGNHDFAVIGGHASDCWTWGFKLANSAFRGKVSGALAERCGLGGFVVSARSEPTDPPPGDIEIADCRAIDCGHQNMPNTTFGFGLLHTTIEDDYPRRVRFLRCHAEDRRHPPGMKWGFFNEIRTPPGEGATLHGCTQSGALIAPTRGFGRRALAA